MTDYGHSFRSAPCKEINGKQNWKYQSNTLIGGQLIAMWDTTDSYEFIPVFESGEPEIKATKESTRRTITGEIRKIQLYHNDELL